MTGYKGNTITYDEVGNPLSYWNGMNFTWENINNLSNISWNGKNISYEYNDEGIRTSKTVNGVTHTYVLEGSKILSEAYGDVLMMYLYDENDAPIGLLYRESSYAEEVFDEYYFTKNLQGDIIGIYDSTGKIAVEYRYDAWGELYSYSYYPESEHIAEINPFRYRGYYFDQETGFYYLNSRYYDPEIKRFISADNINVIGATSNSFVDKNLYAYCDNNPIMRADEGGEFWHIIVGAVVGAAVNFVTNVIQQSQSGEEINWAKAGVAAAAGAVSGALAATGAGPVAQIAANALVSGAESVISQGIDKGFENIDYGEVVSDSVIGGLTSASNGVSKGTAKHLMTQGVNFTKQIAKKGLKKSVKYYYSQTATLFYKPLFKDAFNDIVDTIAKTERQSMYQTRRISG